MAAVYYGLDSDENRVVAITIEIEYAGDQSAETQLKFVDFPEKLKKDYYRKMVEKCGTKTVVK